MKSTSTLCQFLQSWAHNRVSFQTKPNNPELLFDAWSGPLEPPIVCLPFSLRDGRLCATNLGEKKANVKRKAELNVQSKTGSHIFSERLYYTAIVRVTGSRRRSPVCVLRTHAPL